jgi:hypothetical protein
MLAVSYFLISTALKVEFPQIVPIILGAFFGIVGLMCLVSLLYLEILELDNEKLVVRSILKIPKKIIFLRDIISYNEIQKVNKSGTWYDLTIFTKKEQYLLSSSVISNYEDFKQSLIKGKPRSIESEKVWEQRTNRNFGIGFIIVGLLFIYFAWLMFDKETKFIKPADLTTIKATISDNLSISKSKSSRSIHIHIDEQPTFSFDISSMTYRATYADELVAEVIKGDTLQIDLQTDDYTKKISKTAPLTFWDKTINYEHIGIYGIRKGNKEFLNLEALNNEYKNDAGYRWIFIVIFLGIAFWIIYTGISLLEFMNDLKINL